MADNKNIKKIHMKNYIRLRYILPFIIVTLLLFACSEASVNSTGSEYMPEMVHSIAYEANTYGYYQRNNYSTEDDYFKYAQPRLPVKNTVSRGNAVSESHAYFYGFSEEERTRASREIVNNPLVITAGNLQKGKELYTIYCGICHGEKGDGKGYLVRDDGGKYLALPANFLSDDLMKSSNGRYYHAIMRGKNMMEPFFDKLNDHERWQVIQYIRSLQAASKGLVYNEVENSFNKTDKPLGKSDNESAKGQPAAE
jgi:cytochrome c553